MPASMKTIIAKANSYVGLTEMPPNSNNIIFNTDYYGRPVSGPSYPWCCVFLWDIFRMCGGSDLFYGGKKCAYTPTLANYYKQQNLWFSTPKVGDIVFYQFAGSTRINHVGLVIEVLSGNKIKTIEGNTAAGNDANGGAVQIRTRTTAYVKGYGRPRYSDAAPVGDYTYLQFVKDVQSVLGLPITGVADMNLFNATIKVATNSNNNHPVVLPIQKYLNSLGFNVGKEDGLFGPKSKAGVKAFQSWMKKPDGILDAKGRTWKELLKINV